MSRSRPGDVSGINDPLANPSTAYTLQRNDTGEISGGTGIFRANENQDADDGDEDFEITVTELLYSSSSYYAIAKPVTLTMVLAAVAVVYINTDETIEKGQEAMSSAYQVFKTSNSNSGVDNLAMSLANSLIMVSVICGMTFVIVLLYRLRCMMCLIGYMVLCSGTLLGVLGGFLFQTAVQIYHISIDNISFFFALYNFSIVGVLAVFWGQGIPKWVTQGYLIATSVILAWHLSYFDAWTTWCLLVMLALYDLCAVLTPCGPLKFLVDLMSKEDSPSMPGLLFEADLPAEARRPGNPGVPRKSDSESKTDETKSTFPEEESHRSAGTSNRSEQTDASVRAVDIPLAIAKVYNLPVISIPAKSAAILNKQQQDNQAPLLDVGGGGGGTNQPVFIPENPTTVQLRAEVTVQLPANGGSIKPVSKRGKRVYLETDRENNPKRILWVDEAGKVFAEMRGDDEEFGEERNSIRLGMGDFIFYSVLVAKAAQYGFATFTACMLVILAGLGGTLVLLSVYHHALPALPISIFLGVFFYLTTRFFIEPWIMAILNKPFYV